MEVNITETETIEIGDLYPAPCNGSTINLQYSVPSKTRVSIVILKEFGDNDFEHATYLDENYSSCEIQLPDMDSGSYNAWIEINGRTFIRHMKVENNKKSGKWMGKIGKLFQ